jgi:hypothetical protein
MTSRYQILDKDTIIDMFRTKITSHRISHLGLRPRCDIAQINPFSQNKSMIVFIKSDW